MRGRTAATTLLVATLSKPHAVVVAEPLLAAARKRMIGRLCGFSHTRAQANQMAQSFNLPHHAIPIMNLLGTPQRHWHVLQCPKTAVRWISVGLEPMAPEESTSAVTLPRLVPANTSTSYLNPLAITTSFTNRL